ncbi:MAG: DsrE family protein [Actinobacteria bacterium]|nr:DsrE family protein [Actinomycetota bacterium]
MNGPGDMKILIIINDAPYGTEKAYNALRVAMQLQKEQPHIEVRIFLMADAAICANANQNTPSGYYNIELMLRTVINKGGKVKICGTCANARGMKDLKLIDGAEMSNMVEMTRWILESDKILTF